ncbi:glucans biosynthesis glucosyltransferase MdoH [Sulfitobacter sp. LCG007]
MAIQESFAPTRSGTHHAAALPWRWMNMTVAWRRRVFALLNLVTVTALCLGMHGLLARGGLLTAETVMLGAFALTVPWLSIGFWNGVLGYLLDRRLGSDAAAFVTPALGRAAAGDAISASVAILLPVRNENPRTWAARLRRLEAEIARSPWADRFRYAVLSDTTDAEIATAEEAEVERLRAASPTARIDYRRRARNTGYKAGNIYDHLEACGDGFDFFIPLDADSEMGAATVFRMVRVMQASPEIGMLQSLVTGLPSRTFFTRAFQFGMRHGMRSYTLGAAWWQADCGPNWGHNQIIRTLAFREHCRLPVLPGRGPLAGHVLSHDQVEAVLMRRAGYEVRVMAEESRSHEENPPSLVDFIGRELRWMNGNMQYVRLIGMPRLKPVSRMQLFLAIQMYLAAPAWMAFLLLGAWVATGTDQFGALPAAPALGFFALLMLISLTPKLAGLAQVLADPGRAAAYGGRGRVIRGFLAESALMMLVSPVVAFGLTLCGIGLVLGQRASWKSQQRSRARLAWREAARVLWPQTLGGVSLCAWLAAAAPYALPFAAPILLALIGAIPLAVLTTAPAMGRWSRERGLFDIPEDRSGTPDGPCPSPSTTPA